jgi:hypothetical protein
MAVERETYQNSRAGFDLIYNELQKKYDDECLSKLVNLTKFSLLKNCFTGIHRMLKTNINYKYLNKIILLKQQNLWKKIWKSKQCYTLI